MTNNNISIKAINDLLKSKFFIPAYQRGYRWTEQQVTDLLNDINEFSPEKIANSNEETWYCLQPIVVKKNENEWDVIDGQQRLTTIYLILHYLNQGYIEKIFGLEYETRENSTHYLINGLNGENIDNTNIDYYFISSAYKTICEWFNEKGQDFDKKTFKSKFNFSTKIIWYETSQDEDSIDIFTRINSGKIPLTNAELIKALFLNSSNFGNYDAEKLRLKQLEIATEWDRIEYVLQDDSFWYFIDKQENILPTRIDFIFNLMAGEIANLDDYSTFRFFNDKFKNHSVKEINNNWQEIKKYFQTLEEWYNDRELYHKIGFLISTGTIIKDILIGRKEQTKTDFKNWLNTKIQEKVNVDIDQLEYGNKHIRNVLLLHNIQTMLNNHNETNRFPFDRYIKESWDVEHIHAIATEVKVKNENQIEWLKNNFIQTENHQNEDLNNQIEQILSGNTADEYEFDTIIDYVLGEEDNTLQNLCLLDRGTNRSYKNDSFRKKRNKIIEREIKGTFIPICTKNVFMKYYSSEVKDIEVWNKMDRKSYFKRIKDVIQQYLPQKSAVINE